MLRTINFAYGCELLATESQLGQGVEICNTLTREIVFTINIEDHLGSSKYQRHIVDLEIRSSILSIAVVEKNPQRGRNYFLFFAVGSNAATLLLKVPRHRRDFRHDVRREAMYDFNSKFAAVCTLQLGTHPTINL